ncbi:MAG TPA: hypothetical protein ENL12_04735 [Dehalococcoidia bacterium]|nr:hypothetical protein [Dehalococcoidia bacterium]
MAGKSTRITVDLGDSELAKAVRMAAVESGRTVRNIVIEALSLWLERTPQARGLRQPATTKSTPTEGNTRDYRSMIEALNRYRGADGPTST